jgi:hypothetical protein
METDITVTLTERELALVGLGLAYGAFNGGIEAGDALKLMDKLIPDAWRGMPEDMQKRYKARQIGTTGDAQT